MQKKFEQFVVGNEARDQLISRLDWVALKPKLIVAIGDSEGLLKKRYPEAEVVDRPSEDYTADLIFANMVLPWCDNLKQIMQEWRRALKPNGLLVFATLGPLTLQELDHPLSLHLADMHNIGDELVKAGFLEPVLDVDLVTLKYQTELALVQELQTLHLLPEEFKPKANIKATTYEIVYGQAFAPELSKAYAVDASGVVKIPIESLVRRGYD